MWSARVMKRVVPSAALSVALALASRVPAPAQGPPAPPPPPEPVERAPDDGRVVQLSVTLVEVDAVVTDGDGRQVTDLRAEDFEVSEDGRARTIADFSYVGGGTATPEEATATGVPGPPVRLRPDRVRRTIVLVL